MEAILGEWQKRYINDHICGVIRHAERSDAAFALDGTGAGLRWRHSEDASLWPNDPPLSEDGLSSAKDLGKTVRSFAEESGSRIDVVVCSPYTRCMQTGAIICEVLGKGTRWIVDESLGEIYGPSVMGPVEPRRCVRPFGDFPPKGVSRSVLKHLPKTVGRWPTWPEDVRQARRRFANRFLTYLKRSIATRRNFLLVTHADCVGAALSVLPGFAQQVVERIDYGGMLLGRRQAACQGAGAVFRSYLGNLFSVADATDAAEHNEVDVDPPIDDVESPEVPEGWRVVTHGLILHKIQESDQAALDRRTKSLSKHSKFSQEQIKQLLGAMSSHSLDNFHLNSMSESTLIFGESAPTYSWSQHQSTDMSNSAKVANPHGEIVEGIPLNLLGGLSHNRYAQASTQAASSSGAAAVTQEPTQRTQRAEKARELLAQMRVLSEDEMEPQPDRDSGNITPRNGEIPKKAPVSMDPTKPKGMLINSVPTLALLKRRGLGDIRML
jgi:broad specificity phosphatase PhoE